jgi:hypothetical protein
MTSVTGDTISAFAGPALGVKRGAGVKEVLDRHTAIRLVRDIARDAGHV